MPYPIECGDCLEILLTVKDPADFDRRREEFEQIKARHRREKHNVSRA
jgi:hypothetical protein